MLFGILAGFAYERFPGLALDAGRLRADGGLACDGRRRWPAGAPDADAVRHRQGAGWNLRLHHLHRRLCRPRRGVEPAGWRLGCWRWWRWQGACHAVQSAAYEAQRQAYNFWGWGRGGVAPAGPGQGAPSVRRRGRGACCGLTRRCKRLVSRPDQRHWTRRDWVPRLAAHPAAADAAAGPLPRLLRAGHPRLVGAVGQLPARWGYSCARSSRCRCCISGFEIVGFSLILLVLGQRQQTRAAAFEATLGGFV